MTDWEEFERRNPHEKLNRVTREFTMSLEAVLHSPDLPTDVAKRLIHTSRNFLQSLEGIRAEYGSRE